MIIDTALRRREAEGRPLRVGLVGTGGAGHGAAAHIVHGVPGMRLVAVADPTRAAAVRAYRDAGVDPVVAGTADEIDAAVETGTPAVCEDALELVRAVHLDCVVDLTAAVEPGAQVALAAIEHGLPVVTANAGLLATVGPLLAHRARAADVVLTGATGTRPGAQADLLRYVRGLGVTPLVAGSATGSADATTIAFEQAAVADAFGLTVPPAGVRGRRHPGSPDEPTGYDVDELRALGGVVVVGAGPDRGVYVLGTHDDPEQRRHLERCGLGPGPLFTFSTPHVLGHVELPAGVVRAVDFDDAALAPAAGPRVDVVAVAQRDLRAGGILDGPGGADAHGVAEAAAVARSERLLPMGVAGGCVLARDVARGRVLTYADVTLPPGRLVDRLRTEQESLFAP